VKVNREPSQYHLARRVEELEKQTMFLQSKIDAFFTGDVPNNATLDHLLLAKYGRIRLAEKAKTAVLLSK
jgi:hypothetical protein